MLRKRALEDRPNKVPGAEFLLPHSGNNSVHSAGEDRGDDVVFHVGRDSGEQHNGELLPHLDQDHVYRVSHNTLATLFLLISRLPEGLE